MSRKITKFEDMDVWKDAQDYAVMVYELTKSFPVDELYGLTSQMRRCSSSVSANIAEGFGRKSQKDTAHFYKIANGSLLETKNFVYLAKRLEYMTLDKETQLIASSENLQNQISAILRYFNNNE